MSDDLKFASHFLSCARLLLFFFLMAEPDPEHPFLLSTPISIDTCALDRVPENLRERFSRLFLEPDLVEATTARNQIGFACGFLRLDEDKD
jgi:hypothetical protein